MYHWRVLPHPDQSLPAELADVDTAVAYWGGRPEVRDRIEALRGASASIAVFLEYIPQNLHHWLGAQVNAGDEATERALSMVERQLDAGTSFLNAHGIAHFDAHFQNILTDGQRLYFTDYGLAASTRFDLSQDETDFYAEHRAYDRAYTLTHLVTWLITALYGYQRDERDAFLQALAHGKHPTGIPPQAAATLTHHAPLATVMTDFYRAFQHDSRHTPYPTNDIHQITEPSNP